MSNQTKISDQKFPTKSVLAIACCVYRQKGYTSTSTYLSEDPNGSQRWTNKDMVTYQLFPTLANSGYLLHFNPTAEDQEQADAIIKHFRRLTFGVIGDNLNDYMSRVFQVTQIENVGLSDIGVLASVPQVYDKEITAKEIKEQIKDTVKEYLGKEGETITLSIRYIKTKFIPQLNCYSHEAITDTNHLISFLNKIELGKAGTQQKIRARIKKHTVNYLSKTPETQLNYVKVVDNVLVWQ